VTLPAIPPDIVWLNGSFLSASEVRISPLDRGFLYGDGVFETLRAEKGILLYCQDHLNRLHQSLDTLRIPIDPFIPWEDILQRLLEENELSHDVAAVKIIVSRGSCPELGLPSCTIPTVCLSARKYVPPPPEVYEKGWRLHVFQDGFTPPLAGHKTLNYLYFLMARQAALDAGAHEAIILDPHGRVTETAAGSLLAQTNCRWWTPSSSYQLPGTTLKQVAAILLEEGSEIERRVSHLNDFFSAQSIWVMNSLMGIVPVGAIGNQAVEFVGTQESLRLTSKWISCGSRKMGPAGTDVPKFGTRPS
jgi:branched-chain amino acid aminotransferase/para-aminobenzoate synthetase component 1